MPSSCSRSPSGRGPETAEQRARAFIAHHISGTRELEKQANLASWRANLSGKAEEFQASEQADNALDAVLADPKDFNEVKDIRERGGIADPLVRRSIDLIYLSRLARQVDPVLLRAMTAKSSAATKAFNVYRAQMDGARVSENDLEKILRESTDSGRCRKAWEAGKGVGRDVAPILRDLVKLRNESARKLGFRDYYALSLFLNEQDEATVLALFDRLDDLTRKPFLDVKARLDKALAKRFGITAGDLRPWHYQDPFFQDAPQLGGLILDKVFAKKNVVAVARGFYAGIGLPVDDIFARSDLYEREGKTPHAFTFDIDREGDVRVLANLRDDAPSMDAILHELGHAVYDKNVSSRLPYTLHSDAHILATEGIAQMFGRLSRQPEWLQANLRLDRRRTARMSPGMRRALRAQTLVFSRWCQVMLRFERAMYADPDQDLPKLWWDLVEKYQGLHRPENRSLPDYASKIHFITNPVYYHNYMMGELFASQVHAALAQALNVKDPSTFAYTGRPEVGRFLIDKVFAPGERYPWNEFVKIATGEPLTATYYARDFVRE